MILTILASKLSEHEIPSLGKIYNNIDTNKDGNLSVAELVEGLKDMNAEDVEGCSKILMSLDTDKSGNI